MDNDLRAAVADTLEAVEGFVHASSTLQWSPTDGGLPIIRSAILRRQYECLSVAVDLVDKSLGFAAVGLLRPACEEFLWAKYLASLDIIDAENLVICMARKELRDSLQAQNAYAGCEVNKRLGLVEYINKSRLTSKSVNAQIKALGVKLKWDKRTVEASNLPSVAYIAKAVDETKLYRFLYHASSRYVHFSPAELLRRAWGGAGKVTVSSEHFSDYWSAFVMYWGVYLMAATFPVICELGGGVSSEHAIDGEKLLAAARRIGNHGRIPIITAEELAWESDPP